MTVRIINQDILDDDESPLLVQRYIYPSRIYQVIRKPTSPNEQFEVSEGIEIDPDLFWAVNRILSDDSDEEFPEVFAQIFLDEENPPTYDPDDLPDAEPYAYIEYEAGLFHGRLTYQGYEAVDEVSTTTLQEAIDQVLAILDPLISREKAVE
jgi:hypothetical protein